jgi:hypothetical protein
MGALKDRREERFCHELVAHPERTVLESYEAAGFSRDAGNASRKYNLARIQLRMTEIAEPMLDRYASKHEHIVDGFAKIAHADYSQAFDERGRILPLSEMPEDVRYAIASLEVTTNADGDIITKIKFSPRETALRELGKMGGSYNGLAHAGAGVINVIMSEDDAKL